MTRFWWFTTRPKANLGENETSVARGQGWGQILQGRDQKIWPNIPAQKDAQVKDQRREKPANWNLPEKRH